jgi:anti-anti-sigma factor
MLAAGVRRVTIDLRPLSFMDSSGLQEFIALSDRATADGWTLELVRPSPSVLRVLQITHADQHLPLVDAPS